MRNNKFWYYSTNGLRRLLPRHFFQSQLPKLLSRADKQAVLQRVNYYNKIESPFVLADDSQQISSYKKGKGWTYYFDFIRHLVYFNKQFRFKYLPGDITHVPEQASFLKSRPISDNNQNSVLLKLNKVRHFKFVNDKLAFKDKLDMVAWRGVGYHQHRKVIIKQFYQHPRCNIGQTKPFNGDPWEKDYMSINQQLQYKYIICPEGNDVATNLKWVMSSNSLCIMAKPKYETWFMEGLLQAGSHYVQVKEDYSDLIEKVDYYNQHQDEAIEIINNANRFVQQFKNTKQEQLIALLVMQKYFELSGQSNKE